MHRHTADVERVVAQVHLARPLNRAVHNLCQRKVVTVAQRSKNTSIQPRGQVKELGFSVLEIQQEPMARFWYQTGNTVVHRGIVLYFNGAILPGLKPFTASCHAASSSS